MTGFSGEIVYIVDDDAAVLRSVERLLRSADLDARGFGSPAEFLESLPPDASGCVVLDVAMPGLDGLALQKALTERDCELPVLFLTGRGDIPRSVEAMKSGAVDFLLKPVDDEKLLAAVEMAMEKDRARRRDREGTAEILRRLSTLTARERQVFEAVAAGRLNKQIAADLGTAVKTVKIHRGRMMKKMGASCVADLVRQADRAAIRRS